MKTNKAALIVIYLLITGALCLGGILYSTGGSFAEWSDTHKVGYFIDMHARLLSFAGIAISLLCFAFAIGMTAAFARIRQLEALIYEKKTEPNQALEPTSTAVTPPADAGDRASGTRGSP